MAIPINNVPRRVVYAASGTGPYNFSFEILAATDIAVYRDDTLLTLTTDYTVTINANGTGSVTLTATPTGATQIAIVGNRTIQRLSDFVTGGDFFANTLNDELDQQTIFAQQNAEGLSRALQAPISDPSSINMTLPAAATRATKYLGFDASGNPAALPGTGTASIINLATDVTGVLQPANGGTGSTTSTGTGAVVLAASPTISTLNLDGNLNITGSARRITGDFSNATVASRVMFQTSTVNGTTAVSVIPNGTATSTAFTCFNNSDPANSGVFQIAALSTDMRVNAGLTGTGTALPMAFYTNGSERVRVDTSGNVGIGTTNTASAFVTLTRSDAVLRIDPGSGGATIQSAQTGIAFRNLTISSGITVFDIAGVEAMRINAAGELLIGTTTDNGAYLLQVNSQIWATNATIATSDARLKENVAPINGALDTIKVLQPVTFDFKRGTGYNFDDERQTGFIAQDLQAALAGQDYVDCVVKECGPYLGVAYEKLIPVLTKAIQEQQVIIEQLTQRIAALEGA